MADLIIPGAVDVQTATEQTAEVLRTPTPDYQNPFARKDDASLFDSLGAAFELNNTEINAYQSLRRHLESDFEVDPDFDPYEFTLRHKDDPRVQPVFELLLGPEGDRLAALTSEARYWDAIGRLNREVNLASEANFNGALTAFVGGVLGNVMSPTTLVGAATPLTILKGATALRGGKTLAGVVAGVTDAGINAAALAANQELFTQQDALLNLAIGGVMGGIGGQFIPERITVPYDRVEPMREYAPGSSIGEELDSYRASLSAAASPNVKPAERSRLGILDAFSPVGRAIRRSKMADTDFSIHQKLYEISVFTTDNMKGIATAPSAERLADTLHRTMFLVRAEQVGAIYNKMALEVFGEGTIARSAKNLVGAKSDRMTADQFYEAVTQYRRARQVIEDEGDAAAPEARQLVEAPHENPKVAAAIKEAAEVEDRYYTAYADLLQQHGLLTAEERRKFYVPAVINRRMVVANENEFRELLRDHLRANPDPDWLEQVYGVRDIKKLSAADQQLARDEWVIRQRNDYEKLVTEELAQATKAVGATRDELKAILSDARDAERRFLNARLREARMKEAELQTNWRVLREEAAQRRAEYDALQRAYDAGIANANARARQFIDVKPDAGLGRKLEGFFEEPVVTPKAPPVQETPQMRAAKARLDDANKRLREIDDRVATAERKLAEYQNARAELETAVQKLREHRSSLRAAARQKRAALKKAESAEKKAQRKVNAIGKVKTVEEKIDEIVDAIARGKKAPNGILREVVPESNRLKELQLFKGNILMDPRAQKFLINDAEVLADRYGREISPRIGFRQAFGDDVDDSLTQPLTQLKNEWRDRIDSAKSDAEKQKLIKAMEESVRDFEAMRDKLLGIYGLPDNPSSALLWFNKQLRALNIPISLGLSLLSSLTDPAVGMLATSKTFAWVPKFGMRAAKIAAKMKDRELRALMLATEQSYFHSRQSKNLFIEDPFYDAGGIGTGRAYTLTGAIDRGLNFIARNTNVVNGVQGWSAHNRFIFGMVQIDNMVRELGKWSSLSPKQRANWARLGIDEAMAARIAKQLDQHMEVIDGVRVPNGTAWTDAEAYRAFQIAIDRTGDESVVRIGNGDLPLFMSKPAGKLMLQFMSFPFSVTNKYTRLAWQKRDLNALISVTFSMALGTLGYVIREQMKGVNEKGETPEERMNRLGPGDWAYVALTRSPILGSLSYGADAAVKMLRGPINYLAGAEVFDAPVRMADRGALTHLLGPSFGLLEKFEGLASAVLNSPEKGFDPVWIKLRNITPWGQLLPILAVIRAADADLYGR